MSYEKQTFVDNETTLEARHLKYIEDGIVANERAISAKQNALVDGITIKTINGESILGSGNIEIEAAPSGKEASYNTHDFIDKVGAVVGSYVYKNGVITVGTQAAYKYAIVPLSQYNIQNLTVLTGKVANGVIPVLYLKDAAITDANVIGYEFGESSSLLDGDSASSFALFTGFNPPVGTTHVAIGAYVNLTKLVSDASRPAFDEVYKVTVLEVQSGGSGSGEENGGNTYVVRRTDTASGEYATLGGALAVATGKDTIVMYEGVYEENHLTIPGGLTIKGVGNVVIKGYLAPDTDVSTIENYSTFECSYGATFENITVTAQNMRYPIHADFSKGAKAKWVMKKCKFIHYGNEEAYIYQRDNGGNPDAIVSGCSAWGGGTYGGDSVYCEDCEFISNGRGFSTHNNEGATYTTLGPSNVKLVNCALTSHGIDRSGVNTRFPAALFVQSLNCPVECEVVLSNCKINGFVVYQNSGTCWSNKLKLYGCGDVKQVFDSYGSAKTSVADREQNQINKFAADYTGFSITDSMSAFVNRGASAIPAGYPVKKSSYGGVELCTNIAELFGVAMEAIEPKKAGYIQTRGYISRIYLEGLRTTALTEGAYITINGSGVFAVATNIETGMQVVDNQNVHIGY